MNQNLCEGLGHDVIIIKIVRRFNPFRVDVFFDWRPKVARSSQPWADRLNPVGIPDARAHSGFAPTGQNYPARCWSGYINPEGIVSFSPALPRMFSGLGRVYARQFPSTLKGLNPCAANVIYGPCNRRHCKSCSGSRFNKSFGELDRQSESR